MGCFASLLFEKLNYDEGICGRFGRIGVEIVSISGLVGNVRDHATDDLVESFTVCGFLFLWKHEHMNC